MGASTRAQRSRGRCAGPPAMKGEHYQGLPSHSVPFCNLQTLQPQPDHSGTMHTHHCPPCCRRFTSTPRPTTTCLARGVWSVPTTRCFRGERCACHAAGSPSAGLQSTGHSRMQPEVSGPFSPCHTCRRAIPISQPPPRMLTDLPRVQARAANSLVCA